MGQYSDLDDSRKESMELSENDDSGLLSGDDDQEEGIIADDTDSEYHQYTDEDLVSMAQNGDDGAMDALFGRYKNFVRSRARNYFLVGADREDIIQEGMVGFYKAIRDYRLEKQCTFHAFAELCITRQIITAIKAATRQKHLPLNDYVSLSRPIYEEESDRTLMDMILPSRSQNPEDLIINAENRIAIEDKIHHLLSDLEREVLYGYLDEKSYQEIAQELHRHVKSIDNALVRIKKKLEKHLHTEREEDEASEGSV